MKTLHIQTCSRSQMHNKTQTKMRKEKRTARITKKSALIKLESKMLLFSFRALVFLYFPIIFRFATRHDSRRYYFHLVFFFFRCVLHLIRSHCDADVSFSYRRNVYVNFLRLRLLFQSLSACPIAHPPLPFDSVIELTKEWQTAIQLSGSLSFSRIQMSCLLRLEIKLCENKK